MEKGVMCSTAGPRYTWSITAFKNKVNDLLTHPQENLGYPWKTEMDRREIWWPSQRRDVRNIFTLKGMA